MGLLVGIGQWGDVTDVCVNYGAVGVVWAMYGPVEWCRVWASGGDVWASR